MNTRGSKGKKGSRSGKSAKTAPRTPKANSRGGQYRAAPGAVLGSGIQRKLAVGQKDDSFEREADSVADRVTSGQPAPTISKVPSSGLPQTAQREEKKEDKKPEEKKKEEKKPEDEKKAQAKAIQRQEEAAEEKQPMEEEKEEEPKEEEEAAQAKAIQREDKPKEEEKKKEKEDVQKEEEDKPKEEEEATAQAKFLQRKAAPDDSLSDSAEAAVRNKGAGEPLHPAVQRKVEASTGADMRDVRVHRDATAQRAAQSLGARAFTHGKDIWLGKGESPRDTRLMAHEAAHVVQQTGRGQSQAVQRTGETPAARGTLDSPGAGSIDLTNKKINVDKIQLPTELGKSNVPVPITLTKSTGGDQREKWKSEIKIADASVKRELPENKGIPTGEGANPPRIYYLKIASQKSFIVGGHSDVAERVKLPNWDDTGGVMPFQVDHIHEQQLGGAHDMTNFQLVDMFTNKSSGIKIRNEIRSRVKAVTTPHVGKPGDPWAKPPSLESLEGSYTITFANKEGGLAISGPKKVWSVAQIQDAQQIPKLKLLTNLAEAEREGFLVGKADKLSLSIAESAGKPIPVPWGPDGPTGLSANILKIEGFETTAIEYQPGGPGKLTGNIMKNNKIVEGGPVFMTLNESGGLPYTVYADGSSLKASVRERLKKFKPLSPIEIDDAYFGPDKFMAHGLVKPSLNIFKQDLAIDLNIEGKEVSLSKTFSAGDFAFPGPVKVSDSSLTISAGTAGLKVVGEVNFEIESVGKGKVTGEAGTSGGFAVEGEFEFDKKLFNDAEAKIKVRYKEEKFSGEGSLKIGEGKVRGVKSAAVEVKVDDDKWEATGEVVPAIPGIETGTLTVKFDPEGGLEITGRLEFSKDIPRLKSGHIEAKVTKNDEGYQVEGAGAAELDIPGASASITAEYKDGIFKAEGTLGYTKDFISGEITAGVTNMGIGDDGQPTGEAGEQVHPYGKGTIAIQFTPWLKGTAGIKLDPSGKMEVSGRIELPSKVEVFPIKKVEKELLSIGVDIPILGFSVAGQHVGIFFNISGSLTALASVGPGTLENVAVEATLDPEDLSTAHVTGTASFVVPAEAGLRLAISGALGAGIPIVSAKAGIEIGATLGVEGEARADATVEWSPQTGVNMEAVLSVTAQPVFKFDVTGFLEVTADLILTEIELYSARWQLASFEFGSGLTVGAKLTAKVENNEFKTPSFDDIEFIAPDIDLMELASNVIDQVK